MLFALAYWYFSIPLRNQRILCPSLSHFSVALYTDINNDVGSCSDIMRTQSSTLPESTGRPLLLQGSANNSFVSASFRHPIHIFNHVTPILLSFILRPLLYGILLTHEDVDKSRVDQRCTVYDTHKTNEFSLSDYRRLLSSSEFRKL